MGVGGRDGTRPVLLSGFGEDVDLAAALPGHLGAGDHVDRPRRAQIVHGRDHYMAQNARQYGVDLSNPLR